MPIYEYRCQDCGKTFESIQKFSSEPYKVCGESSFACENGGKGKVDRLLGSPALQFKGSGFYLTDYGKSGSSKKSSSDSGKSESKSESKTDSKPAKTESKPAAKAD
jgi:putative FmdB family regulatory protein